MLKMVCLLGSPMLLILPAVAVLVYVIQLVSVSLSLSRSLPVSGKTKNHADEFE